MKFSLSFTLSFTLNHMRDIIDAPSLDFEDMFTWSDIFTFSLVRASLLAFGVGAVYIAFIKIG